MIRKKLIIVFLAVFYSSSANATTFYEDLVLWFDETVECLIIHMTLWAIDIQIILITALLEIGSEFLATLNISSQLTDHFNALPPDVLSMMLVLRIPESLNIILSAVIAKFFMQMLSKA